jgi:hypothetical protein
MTLCNFPRGLVRPPSLGHSDCAGLQFLLRILPDRRGLFINLSLWRHRRSDRGECRECREGTAESPVFMLFSSE